MSAGGFPDPPRLSARAARHGAGLGGFLALLLIVYRPVLCEDGQFAYREAGGHYYPLYQRVQQEWAAGRWPLWDPAQNGGEPLLGTPMAAVLYPGKVLYALLPYAWAARLYVVAHTVIAYLGMLVLGRSCGVSPTGSCLAGLGYAFGAPILLLYSNVIFLVGAAWIPWGLAAIDGLLHRHRRRGAAELAAVLAMQVLGGDPEAAYLTVVCGAAYAGVLALRARERPLPLLTPPEMAAASGLWVLFTLGLAVVRFRPPGFLAANGLALAAWAAIGVAVARGRHRRGEARLAPALAALGSSGLLALALTAVQVLPTLEFAAQNRRVADDSGIDVHRFSLDPFRAAELIWPNVFGLPCPENRSWLQAVPPAGSHDAWVDSLYMGGLTLLLGLSAAGWRGGPPWRAWLTAVAGIGLVVSLGKYAGPLWWARWGPFDAILGPHDPARGVPRMDRLLSDGAGSPYAILAMLLPGFGVFRYPSKFLPFSAAALAVLAGAGWDRASEGDARRLRRLGRIGLAASLLALAAALVLRGEAIRYLAARTPPDAGFGPADVAGAWAETQRALAHGAIVSAAALALARRAPRRPRRAAALAVLHVAADLAAANARLIGTAPQAVFEIPSEAARRIEAAERSDPSPAPFRVHRLSSWYPIPFAATRSPGRMAELIAWGRATLQPMFGLPLGTEYGRTQVGAWELDDYGAFFRPQLMTAPPATARALGVPADQPILYFPRRCFDLWGARYFLLPAAPDWSSRERGFASFLDRTEPVPPGPERSPEGETASAPKPSDPHRDWQLRRNRVAFPRAWIVHQARVRPPARDPRARDELIRILAFMNDPIWRVPGRAVLDLRAAALIESDDVAALRAFRRPRPVGPSESVTVIEHGPQRVELRASLDAPGLVILADTYYPGWTLTIDGRPAPIYRANRLMRGAPVPAGVHTLVYSYEPASFRAGGVISAAGLIALLLLARSSRGDLTVCPRFGSDPSRPADGRRLS